MATITLQAQQQRTYEPVAAPVGDPGGGRPWLAFLVVATGVFLTVLDLFIVNVALPALAREFPSASVPELSWVLTAYAIVFAAALVPLGKLGDLYGRRRLFMGGLVVFLAGSALAAAAQSVPLLLGARAVQALGGAAITPNSLGVVLPLFPPHRRPAAIAAWGAIAGLGAAAGPVLGGLLAQASWRWAFLVNLPVGLVALALVPRLVREIRDAAAARFPDVVGGALLALAIGLLTVGLSQAPAWDWDVRFAGSLLASGLLTALFVRRSGRHPAPVVELPMLRVPAFALAMAASVVFWAGFAALLVSSALFLTGVWRLSILEAGLGLAPGPAIAAVFAGASGRLGIRFGAGRVGAVGGALFAAAGAWQFTRLTAEANFLSDFLPAQLLTGAGAGLILPTLVAITVAGLPPTRLSTGIAVQTMFRQIGAALGVALWVASLGHSAPRSAEVFEPGWLLIAATGAATTAILLATIRLTPAAIGAPAPVSAAASV